MGGWQLKHVASPAAPAASASEAPMACLLRFRFGRTDVWHAVLCSTCGKLAAAWCWLGDRIVRHCPTCMISVWISSSAPLLVKD